MVHMLPESLSQRRWWWLAVGGRKPFTAYQQEVASLMLRQWQTQFNCLAEPGSGRLLIGHDGRLIHADPWTQVQLAQSPHILQQLRDTLYPVASQRWGNNACKQLRDFATDLNSKPYWVCFHQSQAQADDDTSRHWYVELRPLEPEDLPTIGSIEDRRVAQSIAYIHDYYHQSPSLAQVAGAVSVSPFHFHRLFTKHVGISPKHYVQRKQLQVAKWLLRSSRFSIGTVASRSGFASHGHFTSTFQRVVGMTPRQYREQS